MSDAIKTPGYVLRVKACGCIVCWSVTSFNPPTYEGMPCDEVPMSFEDANALIVHCGHRQVVKQMALPEMVTPTAKGKRAPAKLVQLDFLGAENR